MNVIILFPFPPRLPKKISEFPKYKTDVKRWARLSGVDPQIQGDLLLDSIPWNHPWKEHLEKAVGDKVGNNKKGAAEILEHLEGCYELSLLSKMTRDEGVGILTFIRVWESKFEKVQKLGVKTSDISGIDLLYACNLIKEDRNLIRKDLDALNMIYTRQNVANSVRKCYHHEVLKTEDLELVRMQELNKEVKHRKFLSWMFSCV